MPLTLSVVVCAHNEERLLASCLHSVLAQTRLPDEIIVVDNASDDHTNRSTSTRGRP
jgi:glycosyltransferase involved in cell wall biosynthesis